MMIKKLIKKEQGQALVEMALVLPVLLMLLLGIIEAGWIFASYIEVEHAARDGARYAAIHSTVSDNTIKSLLADKCVLVQLQDEDINISSKEENGDIWKEISVNYKAKHLTSFIFKEPLELKSTMAMRIE